LSWFPSRVTRSGRPSPLTSTRSYSTLDAPKPRLPPNPSLTIWLLALLPFWLSPPGVFTCARDVPTAKAGLPLTPMFHDGWLLSRICSMSRMGVLPAANPPRGVVNWTRPLLTMSGKPSPFRSR
jgi:hypothetical protein